MRGTQRRLVLKSLQKRTRCKRQYSFEAVWTVSSRTVKVFLHSNAMLSLPCVATHACLSTRPSPTVSGTPRPCSHLRVLRSEASNLCPLAGWGEISRLQSSGLPPPTSRGLILSTKPCPHSPFASHTLSAKLKSPKVVSDNLNHLYTAAWDATPGRRSIDRIK